MCTFAIVSPKIFMITFLRMVCSKAMRRNDFIWRISFCQLLQLVPLPCRAWCNWRQAPRHAGHWNFLNTFVDRTSWKLDRNKFEWSLCDRYSAANTSYAFWTIYGHWRVDIALNVWLIAKYSVVYRLIKLISNIQYIYIGILIAKNETLNIYVVFFLFNVLFNLIFSLYYI